MKYKGSQHSSLVLVLGVWVTGIGKGSTGGWECGTEAKACLAHVGSWIRALVPERGGGELNCFKSYYPHPSLTGGD